MGDESKLSEPLTPEVLIDMIKDYAVTFPASDWTLKGLAKNIERFGLTIRDGHRVLRYLERSDWMKNKPTLYWVKSKMLDWIAEEIAEETAAPVQERGRKR